MTVLGYIQPEGLVVSIPPCLTPRAHINQNFLPRHARCSSFFQDRAASPSENCRAFSRSQNHLGGRKPTSPERRKARHWPDTLQFYLATMAKHSSRILRYATSTNPTPTGFT